WGCWAPPSAEGSPPEAHHRRPLARSCAMAEPIPVRVLLFAALRDAVGTGEMTVSLAPETATSEALLDALGARHPAIAQARATLRLAVNQHYVRGDVPLATGDEVALITPVSGG
ncbi:MAG: molybdopterin converting factor subunit 1, partial [Bacteroidota bacterium]